MGADAYIDPFFRKPTDFCEKRTRNARPYRICLIFCGWFEFNCDVFAVFAIENGAPFYTGDRSKMKGGGSSQHGLGKRKINSGEAVVLCFRNLISGIGQI